MIANVDMISLALGFTSGSTLMWLAMLTRLQPVKCAPALAGGALRPAPAGYADDAAGAAPVSPKIEAVAISDPHRSPSTLGMPSARDRVLQEPALVPPRQHALELIAWVREASLPHMTAQQLEEVYGEMCVERFWAVHPWQTIATQLGKLTGEKPYAYVNGVRKRIYRLADVRLPGAAGNAAIIQELEMPIAA